jgi:FKBP-type peptidyl-prolyl cis-trans isomerase
MADKFDAMVVLLQRDPQLAAQFGKNPEAVLKQFGVAASELDKGTKESAAALERANAVLKAAAIDPKDSAATALKKVSQQADKAFKKGYNVKVDPIGVVYMERVDTAGTAGPVADTLGDILRRLKGLATVTCTYGPWDGCHGDADF